MDSSSTVPAKRTWHYRAPPSHFEIAGCSCGNQDTQWSEFAKHLWCGKCEKDFVPAHNGIFDGPIPIQAAIMLGMNFDRYDMVNQRVERYDVGTGNYVPASAAG